MSERKRWVCMADLPAFRHNLLTYKDGSVPTTSTKLQIFRSLELFREDLQEIIDLFTANGGTVTLSDGDQTYPSFDEMGTIKGAELAHLVLQNDSVGIKLELQNKNRGLALTTVQTTDKAELTFYRTREFLLNKSRPAYFWADLLPPLSMSVLMACIAFYIRNRNTPITAGSGILLILTLCAGIVLFNSSKISAKASLFVTLKRRHEYPPFIKRNRDNLILMVISLLLGIGGTLLVQYLRR